MNRFAQNLEINFKILFRICLETTQATLICESFNAIRLCFNRFSCNSRQKCFVCVGLKLKTKKLEARKV